MTVKKFLPLFLLLGVFDLVAIVFELPARWLSKPLIMISLLAYFWYNTRGINENKLRHIFALALLFALGGDILLLNESWFIAGLGSFLIMQVLYSYCFLSSGFERSRVLIAVIVLGLFAMAVNVQLWPYLGALQWPVLFYTIAISIMTWAAFVRPLSSPGFLVISIGAFAFLVSDMIIALNQFHPDIQLSGWLVMATYIPAQFLIVFGYTQYLNHQA